VASVNKVILLGNLGKDPESKFLANGDAVCNISIATSESWKDKASGEKKEDTQWHNIVLFRRLAEIVVEYCKKGTQIYVEGKIKTRKYQKDGADHYMTEIHCDSMKIISSRKDEQSGGNSASAPVQSRPSSAPQNSGVAFADLTDDIPF